jgi:Mn2+/Fe2+ NRAMP family transporter
VLVASFTLVTIVNLFALQTNDDWAVRSGDILRGLQFRLTPADQALVASPLATALATFGIIGVGASELVAYPYWCLEKGYARFTGPHEMTDEWADRARGWLRVLRWDAWCSMVVYTFATVAFYLLGASILGRIGLSPEGSDMIRTLSVMYEPVFGTWAQMLFLLGAFAVLYSTFFVSTAGHSRTFSDALRVCRITSGSETSRKRLITACCAVFPFLSLSVYVLFPHPARLVLASGVMQAIMLPMLGGAALFFRYRRCDPRVAPGRLWDVLLWISCFGLLLAGGWLALTKMFPSLEKLG